MVTRKRWYFVQGKTICVISPWDVGFNFRSQIGLIDVQCKVRLIAGCRFASSDAARAGGSGVGNALSRWYIVRRTK